MSPTPHSPLADGALLTPAQARSALVERLTAAATQPISCQEQLEAGTLRLPPGFGEVMGSWFNAYHSFISRPVKKEAFEAALLESAQALGASVSEPESATNPGYDLVIEGQRVSCKTETPRSPHTVYISKLMECAWSKGLTRPEQFVAQLPRLIHHFSQYDAVITLRNSRQGEQICYELVEIPLELLRQVEKLRPEDFSPVLASGSTNAQVLDEANNRLFTLSFDGSDNKIQLRNLRLTSCVTLCRWWVDLPARG